MWSGASMTLTAPESPVTVTAAPLCCQRSRTSGRGNPQRFA